MVRQKPRNSVRGTKPTRGERSCRFALNYCRWLPPASHSPSRRECAPASAQESVKIGLILPMTGGQASTGKQIDNAVKLYMQQKGDTVAGKKIEIILKDDGAVPDNTKRLAQELIVNDKVNFIAGFGVTPGSPCRGAAGDPGQDPANRDGGRHLDHHRALALYRAHQFYPGAVLHHHRRLGRQERHQEGRDADLRLRARQRRAELLQAELHRRRRRDRRRGQGAAGQSRLRAVPAADEGFQARRRCSCSCRPGRAAIS